MAVFSILKRNDLSDWDLVSGWHDIGGGVMGVENGEVGVATIEITVTTTSGTGGAPPGGDQDGLFLDIDDTTPVTSEGGLPAGFQILTIGDPIPLVAPDFGTTGGSAVFEFTIDELSVPSLPYTFITPPNNALLFVTFTVEMTVTTSGGVQTTYNPSGAGVQVAAIPGTYDLDAPAPGDPLSGWYSIQPNDLRSSGDAELIVNPSETAELPREPRGMLIHGPFTEANPFWGSPGHAVGIGNKVYYAAGGYEYGVGFPTIRVWDGSTDSEVCRLPPLQTGIPPIAITSMVAMGDKYIVFGVWNSGSTSSDLSGAIYRLKLSDGSLRTLIFSSAPSGGLGHIPCALLVNGTSVLVGSHRGDASSPGCLWISEGDSIANPENLTWKLLVDLAGTGQGSIVSLARGGYDEVFSFIFGTSAPAGTFAKIGQFVFDYPNRTEDLLTGSGGAAAAYNGFYAVSSYAPSADNTPGGKTSFLAAYWNPDASPVSKIVNGSSSNSTAPVTSSTLFTDPAGAQIMMLFIDGTTLATDTDGTIYTYNWTGISNGVPYSQVTQYGPVITPSPIYMVSAKLDSGTYTGTIAYLNNPDDLTDWHDVTTQFVLTDGAVTLANRALTNAVAAISL
ncbi:MAG: hypothetical protein LC723_13940 [Actinobacteria bacterium]|nr:hypothetical protein [Actinomycetota bacterium]